MKFAVKYLVKRALVRTITHLFCNFLPAILTLTLPFDFVQSAMDLSRGKITFYVYRGILEKDVENQVLVVGHLK